MSCHHLNKTNLPPLTAYWQERLTWSLTYKGADNVVYLHLQEEEMVWEASGHTSVTFLRLCLCLTFSVSLPSFLSFTKETCYRKVIVQIFFLRLFLLSRRQPGRGFGINKQHSETTAGQAWGEELPSALGHGPQEQTLRSEFGTPQRRPGQTQHTRGAVRGPGFPSAPAMG